MDPPKKTASIADQHAWIYIHQTRNTLCIHRLDKNGREDELGICAQNLAEMDELGDITQMYVCTNYLKEFFGKLWNLFMT